MGWYKYKSSWNNIEMYTSFVQVLWLYPDNDETVKVLGYIYVQPIQIKKGEEIIREAKNTVRLCQDIS